MESVVFGHLPTTKGDDWSGVVHVTDRVEGDDEMSLGCLLPWKVEVLLLGWEFPEGCDTWSLYHWKVAGSDPLCLCAGQEGDALPRALALQSFSSLILELCAGSGAMGAAATFAGAEVAVSIDDSPYVAAHLQGNSHGIALAASLEDIQTIHEAHLHLGTRSATAMLGFPCQPFSSQGLQLADEDTRFLTLLHALHAVWLLPVQALIAECVPAAGKHQAVLKAFQLLVEARGWEQIHCELDLRAQWPMKRLRWWSICAPPAWMAGPFHSWQVDPTYTTIGSLLRSWPIWDVDEEHDLLLTEHELLVFGNSIYGDDQRWFGPQHVLPTLLHSYGAWFTACPCGCRAGAMSESSLRARGVRGFCVTSALSGQPRLLHPAEAALFLGLPSTMTFMQGPRETLPLLGNVASPLQALWVYGQLLSSVLPDFYAISPKIVLDQFKQELLRQFHVSHHIQVPLVSINLAAEDGTSLSLLAPGHMLVADLIKAERLQLHPDSDCVIADGHRTLSRIERLLPLREGRCYHVRADDPYAKVSPLEVLVLALHDEHAHCIEFLHAGQFLFEALDRSPFVGAMLCVDPAGRLFPRDARIWQSLRLKILSHDTFPTMRTTSSLSGILLRQARPPSAGSAMGPGTPSLLWPWVAC